MDDDRGTRARRVKDWLCLVLSCDCVGMSSCDKFGVCYGITGEIEGDSDGRTRD